MCDTPQCDLPLHADDAGALICVSCADLLRRALRAVGDLLVELEVTTTKQDRIGEPGPRSSETPLPYRPESAEHADRLHTVLVMWARAIADQAGVPLYDLPVHDPGELGRWLARHMETIRRHPDAGAMVADVVGVVKACRRAIDHPPRKLFLGPCGEEGCQDAQGRPVQLYAGARARELACPGCGAVHDVAARRAWLLEQLDGTYAVAEDLSRGLPGLLGEHQAITVAMIHGWARAGRLTAHPPAGRPRYRVGDVIDLLGELRAEREARAAARTARKAAA